MNDITRQRCSNHVIREAVALCLECGRFFCRECITEHADRVLCASCLRKSLSSSSTGVSRFGGLIRALHFLSGGVLLWVFFYYIGQVLLSLPASFHEGTLWQGKW